MGVSVKSIQIITVHSMSYSERFEFETEEVDGTTEGL